MHQPMMVLWTATEVRAIRWIVVVGLFVVLVGAGHRRVIMQPTTRPAEQAESAAIDARLASLRQRDLNTADALTLESLPGIGPVTANAIIAYRRSHGRFRSVDELRDVPGLAPGVLDRVRGWVTVGEPGGG